MLQTIQTLLNICFFRNKPQDLPASGQLLFICITTAFIFSTIRISAVTDYGSPLVISLSQIALIGVGLKILLMLYSKPERWLQAASGLFGCSALLMLMVMPILLGSGNLDMQTADLSMSKLILMAVNLWYFAIMVFILKETLEIKIILAVIITFCMELLFATVLLQMFGDQIL